MSQYYQLNIDDLKKICPNIDVDNHLLLQVDNEVGIHATTSSANHQQYIMQDDTMVLNDNQQQHIVYQQQPQAQQSSQQQPAQQYIIQQSSDDHMQKQQQQVLVQQQQQQQVLVQQQPHKQLQQQQSQQIFYTSNDQMLQQAPSQTQQQTIVYRSVAAQPQQQHQQLLNNAHVLVQQPQQQVIIQQPQQIQQTQQINPQQQQTQHIILRQQLPQQRVLYNPNPNRTVLYTQSTPQQQQSNQQQVVQQQHTPQQHHITPQQQHIQIQSTTQTNQTITTSRIVQNRTTSTPQQQQSQNIVFHPVQNMQTLQQQQQHPQSHTLTPIQTATTQSRQYIRAVPSTRISVPNSISTIRCTSVGPRAVRPASPFITQPQTQPVRATVPRGGRGGRANRGAATARQPRPTAKAAATIVQTPTTQKVYTIPNNALMQQRIVAQQAQQRLHQQSGQSTSDATTYKQTTVVTQKNAVGIMKPQQTSNSTTSNTNINQTNQNIISQPQPVVDIEESIQAIIVERNSEQRTQSTPPAGASTTLTTYYNDPDDEKKCKKEATMPLTEYKKLSFRPTPVHHNQQRVAIVPKVAAVTTAGQAGIANRQSSSQSALVIPKLQQNTTGETSVNQAAEVPSSIQQTSHNNYEIQTKHVIQNRGNHLNGNGDVDRNSARMLVVMNTGEQRLITFTLPRESCTVQDLLEQVSVPFDQNTTIQCTERPGADIDFVVTVGFSSQEYPSELISRAAQTLQATTQQQQQQQPKPTPSNEIGKTSPRSNEDVSKKLIAGFYAVCKYCGLSGFDHAKCERCHTVFTEEPKRVPIVKNANTTPGNRSDDDKKRVDLLGRSHTKAVASLAGSAGRGRATSMARGRGRQVRPRQVEAEPVILTLSSDDEDDEVSSTTKLSAKIPPFQSAPMPQVNPFHFEPIIPEDDSHIYADFKRENVADIENCTDKLYTSFMSKVIRIGTYRYQANEPVTFTTRGLRIFAPSCSKENESVILDIYASEIVKVVTHFSRTLSVIFIYTMRKCGEYIRESLDMKPKSVNLETPYYNPGDRGEPYKRIVIELDIMTEEAKAVIKSIFQKSVLEEISAPDAHELLLRSSAKDKFVCSGNEIKPELGDIRQILIYPQGKGGISINTEDYMCLATEQYLNDVIIDFYLKWLHMRVLTPEQQYKTHIFSTFFYKRLTTMTSRQRHSDKDIKLTAAQKRHSRVQNWTKNVNLFEKDFIVIPINEQSHWFLAIICFPSLMGPVTVDTNEPVVPQQIIKKKKAEKKMPVQIGNTTITPVSKKDPETSVCIQDDDSERDEAEGDDSDFASDDSIFEGPVSSSQEQPIKQPLILIFDSLAGASRSRVVATLRDYLTCEYKIKIKENSNHSFNKLNMPGHCVKVPQQNNFTDCGLFLLQYVEHFFQDPIIDYRLPVKQLINWFETIVVTRKREDISNLLKELIEEFNPNQPQLPEISLPTLNGKLVEQEDSFNDEQADFEEDDMEEDALEDEEDMTDDFSSPEKSTKQTISNPAFPTLGQKIVLKRHFKEIGSLSSPVVRKSSKLDHNI